jgi:hypothetical protein
MTAGAIAFCRELVAAVPRILKPAGSGTALVAATVLIAALLGASRTGVDQRDFFGTLRAALNRSISPPLVTPCPVPLCGHHVSLSCGKTYYVVDGRENKGPLVVMVHGFVGSSHYFRFLSAELVKQGRRVLRFDLMGRGRSSFDGFPLTDGAFAGQLAELLFALDGHELGAQGPIDLIGYSMGGASKTRTRARSLASWAHIYSSAS